MKFQILAAAALALAPISASAVTTHSATDTLGGGVLGFGDGLIYSDLVGGNTLTVGSVATVTVTQQGGSTSSAVGFRTTPVLTSQMGSVSLTLNTDQFTGMTMALSADAVLDGTDVQTVVGSSSGGSTELSASLNSPFWVLFNWSSATGTIANPAPPSNGEAFTYSLAIQPIPVPAGFLLLGTAFVAAGAARRFGRKAV